MIGDKVVMKDGLSGILCAFLGSDVGQVRAVIKVENRYDYYPLNEVFIEEDNKPLFKKKATKKKTTKKKK